jgi:hypothetical protein
MKTSNHPDRGEKKNKLKYNSGCPQRLRLRILYVLLVHLHPRQCDSVSLPHPKRVSWLSRRPRSICTCLLLLQANAVPCARFMRISLLSQVGA